MSAPSSRVVEALRLHQHWEPVPGRGDAFRSQSGLVHVCPASPGGPVCGFSFRDEAGRVVCAVSGFVSVHANADVDRGKRMRWVAGDG